MCGHHLKLGKLNDFLTEETLDDTHDERYRQKIARFLVQEKGYRKADLRPRVDLFVSAGGKRARTSLDWVVYLAGHASMVVKYGPGSLVTRHRPALAAARLVAPYQIPLVVVTNGEDADLLDGPTGKRLGTGLAAIPTREQLCDRVATAAFSPVPAERARREACIVYAFEIDDSCPCDETVCRLGPQPEGAVHE